MVVFDSAITVKTVKEFYEDLKEEVKDLPENSDEKIDVYFSTNGGVSYLVPYLYSVINKYKSKIRLILSREMCSSGFDLLCMLRKTEIYAGPEFTISMTHKGSQRIDVIHAEILAAVTENANRNINLWKKRYKAIGFTQEELKQFTAGADIYFDRKRTLELFPNIIEYDPYGR